MKVPASIRRLTARMTLIESFRCDRNSFRALRHACESEDMFKREPQVGPSDQWGPIGGEGDHSAANYDWVREEVAMLGNPADDQYAYLVENGFPTTELLEQFFSVVPGFLPFLLAR